MAGILLTSPYPGSQASPGDVTALSSQGQFRIGVCVFQQFYELLELGPHQRLHQSCRNLIAPMNN